MNDMTLNPTFLALAAVCFVAILVLDVLPRFMSGHLSVLLSLLCVGLHVPLMPLMLFAGFTLEWMILAYAASVFAFTLAHYVRFMLDKKREAQKEGEV